MEYWPARGSVTNQMLRTFTATNMETNINQRMKKKKTNLEKWNIEKETKYVGLWQRLHRYYRQQLCDLVWQFEGLQSLKWAKTVCSSVNQLLIHEQTHGSSGKVLTSFVDYLQ